MLIPEVAGQLGPITTLTYPNSNKNLICPKIENLEYIFYGWMGDELITSHPIFIITESLGKALVESKLTGFKLTDFTYSKEIQFEELRPDIFLPKFVQLDISSNLNTQENHYLTSCAGLGSLVEKWLFFALSGKIARCAAFPFHQ